MEPIFKIKVDRDIAYVKQKLKIAIKIQYSDNVEKTLKVASVISLVLGLIILILGLMTNLSTLILFWTSLISCLFLTIVFASWRKTLYVLTIECIKLIKRMKKEKYSKEDFYLVFNEHIEITNTKKENLHHLDFCEVKVYKKINNIFYIQSGKKTMIVKAEDFVVGTMEEFEEFFFDKIRNKFIKEAN